METVVVLSNGRAILDIKKIVVGSIIVWGAWATYKAHHRGQPDVVANRTEADVRALAATVQADDIVMYSTSECVYCIQAKNWLHNFGFAFTECNMSVDNQCLKEFKSYGADGTPFLIVRGHQMKDGFDSDELIAALTKS